MEGLVRVCGHVVVRGDGGPGDRVLNSVLELTSDPDYNIRLKFKCVHMCHLKGS